MDLLQKGQEIGDQMNLECDSQNTEKAPQIKTFEILPGLSDDKPFVTNTLEFWLGTPKGFV